MITSSANPQIKQLIQLQKKRKIRNEQKVYVIEGRKMFEEARDRKDGYVIKVYFSESFVNEERQDIQRQDSQRQNIQKQSTQENNIAKDEKKKEWLSNYTNGIPYEIIQDSVFKNISETITPQGVLAIVKQREYSFKSMIQKEQIRLLLLEDIKDPGNLGTIIRTAEGAGVTGIILSKESVDIYNPKVIRSTMGSIFRVPFLYAEDFWKILQEIKSNNILIFAAHLSGAVWYDEVSFSKRSAIMIGNEANGLSKESTNYADYAVKIPMEGGVESLNAAVAAAILLYERARQLKN